MKYRELVSFDPVESVIKLVEADRPQEAMRLVRTYVMSDSMAKTLKDLVIPQLQFENPFDNKGIFIVGNYGTGKSHLMSVISAIAEDKEMLELVNNQIFQEAAQSIAGKFEVLRFEIGTSKMDLRDLMVGHLEKDLAKRGIDYRFPSMEEAPNTKDYLLEMMDLFQEKYPDKGYLIVADEFLDYLRGLTEQKVVLALNFLREIGEISKNCRLRFMAGVQESLFDSGQFAFVADSLRRVRDRYEQVVIRKQDISYVVSERILKKDERQKAWIREHLTKFSHLYSNMADRLEEYVNLYPIHPAYIEIFEKVYIAEKREVLKTITHTIKKILDKDVPEDETGIISYDSYWEYIKENISVRSDPDLREVVEKSGVLEDLILKSYTRPQYRPIALRIIHALSVHRLTTGDINAPIGITVDNMKDDLCIYTPMPEVEESFLKTTVETAVREILKTVSGQFISYNRDNEQYYLDLKKDIDYDAKIQAKADFMDDDMLNKYYYDALLKVLNWERPEHITGRRIWQYEIIWEEKKVERYGYLFFGAPNERTTAQPPRDFYIYFLSPYGKNAYQDEIEKDEVVFEFINRDEEVDEYIKQYAASMELAMVSSADSKQTYFKKAEGYLKAIVRWIKEHVKECFTVKTVGEQQTIQYWLKGKAAEEHTVKEFVDMTASACLSTYFNDKYPHYPRFYTQVTRENMKELFKAGLNYLAGRKNELGAKVLDSLGLLEGDMIAPENSIYACHYIKLLENLPEKHVLNREDILEDLSEVTLDKEFQLEDVWVTLILCALVYSGHATLTISGHTFDATKMEEIAAANPADLFLFKYCQVPEGAPVKILKKLFEGLGLTPGLITNPNTRETAIEKMLVRAEELTKRVIETQQFLISDLALWDKPAIDESTKENYKESLKTLKDFLDAIKQYNTPAKLKNFRFSEDEVASSLANIEIMQEILDIRDFKLKVDPYVSYLTRTCMILKDDKWNQKVQKVRSEALDKAQKPRELTDTYIKEYVGKLQALKKEYISIYMDLHKKYRLDFNGDKQKQKLLESTLKHNLDMLTCIGDLIYPKPYEKMYNRLLKLKTCFSLIEDDINMSPLCPHCGYTPDEDEQPVFGVVEAIEKSMEELFFQWEKIVLEILEDEKVRENIALLDKPQRQALEGIAKNQRLPDKIDSQLVSTINMLMKGLDKVEITAEDLVKAIFKGGPVTVADMKQRLNDYIDEMVKGMDVNRVRIMLK